MGSRRISHVLITHTHRDHTDGLPALLAATGAKTVGFGRRAANRGTKRTSPSGGEFVDQDFIPDIPLKDGERLEGDGWAVTALHTPGHAPDHLCFALEGTRILFSGDHVMGWNTSVVAPPEGNMGAYIRSLQRLTERSDARRTSRATAARSRTRSAWSRPTCCTGACASSRSSIASATAPTRCAPSCPSSTRASTPSSSTLRLFRCSLTLST